jgi:hypothetical protein
MDYRKLWFELKKQAIDSRDMRLQTIMDELEIHDVMAPPKPLVPDKIIDIIMQRVSDGLNSPKGVK